MKAAHQDVVAWRAIGVQRFWLDASSGRASDGLTEFREFVNNPNFIDSDPPPIFGGEAFPLVDSYSPPNEPLPPGQRYQLAWPEFNYAPFMISLTWAEHYQMNGRSVCPGQPATPGDHLWNLLAELPSPPYPPGPREGAIFPTEWPTCDGQPHPDWDEPWERLRNLYNWYICRGFTFWQGDLNGAQSGAAERFFGFGKIDPPGDFDGDGVWVPMVDWGRWNSQYLAWRFYTPAADERLTYYHGDMNGDGVLNGEDEQLAEDWLFFGNWGNPPAAFYPLPLGPNGPPNASLEMNWNPNEKWLPCPFTPSSGP